MPEQFASSLHNASGHIDSQRYRKSLSFNSKPRALLTEESRRLYKDHIFPEVDRELGLIFNSDQTGGTFTIFAYMAGKSRKILRPTIFIIGQDFKTREAATKAIKKSALLDKYPDWRVTHSDEFPNFPQASQESSFPDDFEFLSTNGRAIWLGEGTIPGLATEVYINLGLYSDPSKLLPSRGLAIYVKQSSGLRLATANIVQLDNRTFLQTVYHAFNRSNYQKEPSEPSVTQEQSESLTLVGCLLVWSVDRDWALVHVLNNQLNSAITRTLNEDKEANRVFQSAGRPSNSHTNTYTWTATSGKLEVALSETTIFMKLPNSISFQEIHRVRLVNGSWSNGDSGAVVIDLVTGLTFGHVLGGSQSQGVAFIIAADQVVKDLQELKFSSPIHENLDATQEAQTFNTVMESTVVDAGMIIGSSHSQLFQEDLSRTQEPPPKNPSVLGDRRYSIPSRAQSPSSGIETLEITKQNPNFTYKQNIGGANPAETYQENDLTDDSLVEEYLEPMTLLPRQKKLPLSKGNNINTEGGLYGNALQAASAAGHEPAVMRMLNKGANVNVQGGHYGNPLQAASAGGYGRVLGPEEIVGHKQTGAYYQVVKLLLENGADVNAVGGHYATALQAASAGGHEKIIGLLLDAGAEVNVQGGHYGNALQGALYKGKKEIIKLLLDAGADVNIQSGRWSNPLEEAFYEGNEQIIRLLLDAGADVNAQGGYYGNPLQLTLARGYKQLVKVLLEKGADVNAQGGHYGNALQAASYQGDEQTIELLLNAGAKVNAPGGHYGNALQAASAGGHEKVVRLLLDAGAKVNAQGGHYGNALQAALEGGHEQVVGLLLDNDTDDIAPGG